MLQVRIFFSEIYTETAFARNIISLSTFLFLVICDYLAPSIRQ